MKKKVISRFLSTVIISTVAICFFTGCPQKGAESPDGTNQIFIGAMQLCNFEVMKRYTRFQALQKIEELESTFWQLDFEGRKKFKYFFYEQISSKKITVKSQDSTRAVFAIECKDVSFNVELMYLDNANDSGWFIVDFVPPNRPGL